MTRPLRLLQTWATEVLPAARAAVVSGFAGCLFAGSALSSWLLAGSASAGHYSAGFAGLMLSAVPLGVAATVSRARLHTPVVKIGGRNDRA